jgi:hypothetical protein
MLIVDRLLVGGIRFVLDKVASAVETEMNDVDRLRDELLAAQMRFELGEIDAARLQQIELDLLPQIRALNERQRAEADEAGRLTDEELKVSGIEAEFLGEPTHLDDRESMIIQAPVLGALAAESPAAVAPPSRPRSKPSTRKRTASSRSTSAGARARRGPR